MKTTLILALTTSLLATAAPAQCPSACAAKTPVSMQIGPADIVDTAIAAGSFKTLVTAVKTAGLVDALKGKGPFTVFAPADAAFAKLPEGTVADLLRPQSRDRLTSILTWHVVPGRLDAAKVVKSGFLQTLNGQRLPVTVEGDSVMVGGAPVVKTDIGCSNGVIHVIGSVMLPAGKNIVEVAAGAGTFKTLIAAAKAAGLAPALMGKGPFTVFAPTDEAFTKLPEGTVESLLRPENREKLASILKYHVVSGRSYSDRVVAAGSLETLQGGSIHFKVEDGCAFADDAKILTTDIDASNGVVHVIDSVILPK